jgi:serine/threonine-protein kinase RsbW
MNKKGKIIINSLEEINNTVINFEKYLQDLNLVFNDVCSIKLCLQEALLNGFIHGNNYDKTKDLIFTYAFNEKEHYLKMIIEDEGDGFDLSQLPDPTNEENILNEHGRGVFIVKEYMDSVKYNKKGNKVTLIKKIKN